MANTFSPDIMTADRFAQMDGAWEPQRSNNASLRIANAPGEDDLVLALRTFPLPKQSNGSIEMDWMNEKRKFAGKAIIDDFELGFDDFVDKEVAQSLWDWRLQVYDPETGFVGLARDYKKKADITMFAPDGSFQRVWEIYGLWPSNMDPGDIDMAGEEALRISMSLVADKAIWQGGQTAS